MRRRGIPARPKTMGRGLKDTGNEADLGTTRNGRGRTGRRAARSARSSAPTRGTSCCNSTSGHSGGDVPPGTPATGDAGAPAPRSRASCRAGLEHGGERETNYQQRSQHQDGRNALHRVKLTTPCAETSATPGREIAPHRQAHTVSPSHSASRRSADDHKSRAGGCRSIPDAGS